MHAGSADADANPCVDDVIAGTVGDSQNSSSHKDMIHAVHSAKGGVVCYTKATGVSFDFSAGGVLGFVPYC